MTTATQSPTAQTVSIGIIREDGDFHVLATLNNNDELYPRADFESLAATLARALGRAIQGDIKVIERQDAPDYVCLDDQEPAVDHESRTSKLIELLDERQLEEFMRWDGYRS